MNLPPEIATTKFYLYCLSTVAASAPAFRAFLISALLGCGSMLVTGDVRMAVAALALLAILLVSWTVQLSRSPAGRSGYTTHQKLG